MDSVTLRIQRNQGPNAAGKFFQAIENSVQGGSNCAERGRRFRFTLAPRGKQRVNCRVLLIRAILDILSSRLLPFQSMLRKIPQQLSAF